VRGVSVDNPVLLWLDGGPGQSGLAFTRALFADLERDFVVVDWDQRGVGKSYPALDPPSTWTLDQAVSDTIELTNYLRQRFDEEKIYLGGESWGTTLGVLAVQRHPELYHAYIGSGQMVSQRETDLRIYHDLLAYAERTGDDGLEKKLRDYGAPPYDDVWAYGYVMEHYELIETNYDPPAYYEERGEESGIGPWGLLASEYTFVEKVNVLRGLIDMFAVMYPQLQDIDFRRDVPRLEVPVYLFDGTHELSGRRDPALEWYGQLQAPIKRIYVFDSAGHAPAREEFQAFHRIMIETVVPETYARS
jgi:pimeloyl-ACP methyl ester carboxylesterase